jgi:PAS domain S-box-containing protein
MEKEFAGIDAPALAANGRTPRMSDLVWGFKWEATPLGPAAFWPPGLKTTVRILLTSRFPMWMAWGPELTVLYNDAYARTTLGGKHPWALGKPARMVWSEIWKEIGPRIERVLKTGEASWDETLPLILERSGYPEESYHTFSYSPLTAPDGSNAGMLCVVMEDTSRVVGERQVASLGTLAATLVAANTKAEVFAAIERGLAGQKDIPFGLVYLFNDDGSRLKLVARCGIEISHPAACHDIVLGSPVCPWPSELLTASQPVTVKNLTELFADLPAGSWDRPPEKARLVPISRKGQIAPAGVFISAVNPYRELDANYAGFLDLTAGQIAASITNAEAFEVEKKRAEALAELDRAKTSFFSNVSHELRTPLTLIESARRAEQKPMVLLVDDDADMRAYVRGSLSGRFEVVSEPDGRAALETAQRLIPDLVLTDVMMPEMDRFALLTALRNTPALRLVPVIMLCAQGDESRVEGLEEGADDYLTKPFTARELVARVEAQLKMARLRKQAGEQEAALTREVQQARQFAWEALEHIPDSFATLDRDYRVTYMNPAAARISGGLGIPHLGRCLWDLYPVLIGTPVEENLRRVMDGRVPVEFEQYFRTEDSEKWFRFQVYPQPGEGVTVYMRETTEARRTEQALRRSEQLAAAGRLAASIAHEINNPLEAVTNLLFLVRMDQSLTAQSKGFLEVADRELQRLSHIASRSLKFYRQRTAPSLTPIDELIESVLFFHETEFKLRSIDLRRRYRKAPPVFCLAGEIQQVLTNLISNALEAIPSKGRMYVRVSPVANRDGQDGVAITIADCGAGMDHFTKERLFHPFVTTKGDSGTGLGLWVSKGILDKHHGKVQVRSQKGSGTVFRIFLPLDTTLGDPEPASKL